MSSIYTYRGGGVIVMAAALFHKDSITLDCMNIISKEQSIVDYLSYKQGETL
jgi:hypothetical protein